MNGGVWEIEEEEESDVENSKQSDHHINVPTIPRSTSADGKDVYVAVGKKSSSVDALSWALKHVAEPSSFVYLVHVFPEVHHIPTPFFCCLTYMIDTVGMLPKNQVTAQQVETFMSQERTRRRELLQKFLNLCHASQVQVDTLLIESDLVAKAVIDLIPVLNIKKIVVGTTKSNKRKMKKGNSKAEQIYKSAPEYCEVKIICDGKEVSMTDQTTPPSQHSDSSDGRIKENKQENGKKNSASCICFSGKFI